MSPHEVFWAGRRIESYTKDELIEIVILIALDSAQLEEEVARLKRGVSSGFIRGTTPLIVKDLIPTLGDRS